MADREVNITYDTLFEILRRERSREELGKLDSTFFDDVLKYIRDKRTLLSENHKDDQAFSTEREKLQKHIENTKKILKELYDRREKKIVMMAINKVRTNAAITDKSVLLTEEAILYEELVNLFSTFRKDILLQLLYEKEPIKTNLCKPAEAASTIEPKAEPKLASVETAKPAETIKDVSKAEAEPADKTMIRFLHEVPKFVGPELEVYGPFYQEDVARVPTEIARILIDKGRAEEIIGK